MQADYPYIRNLVQSMMRGGGPNGITPNECGQWSDTVEALYTAHAAGGTAAVRRTWGALVRANPRLAGLVAGDGKPSTARGVPELPAYATAIYEHEAPCAMWLDAYVNYANEAAPMTPRSFHEASGLFLASVAIARRVHYVFGSKKVFPNLFFLMIAPSTLYKKTTGMDVAAHVMEQAGIDHLLLPAMMTPQSFAQELGTNMPKDFDDRSEESKERWLRTRTFAAQRGWMVDEASGFFNSFKREYSSGMHEILLKVYESKDKEPLESTISRDEVVLHNVYVNFIGATTPIHMQQYITDKQFWVGGMWPRFALITPDAPPVYYPQPDEVQTPSEVIYRLNHIWRMFPRPEVAVRYSENGKKATPYLDITNVQPPEKIVLEEGVKAAYDAYNRAIEHDVLLGGNVNEILHPSYGRLAMHAFKVAMILATMDAEYTPVAMTKAHFARAQRMVEAWRRSLHRLYEAGAMPEDSTTGDKIVELLDQAGYSGMTAREIYRAMHLKSGEGRALLEELAKSGAVVRSEVTAKNGRKVEVWSSVTVSQEVSQPV